MTEKILTQYELKQLINYNPHTGIFTRLTKSANRVNVGDVAGFVSESDGYSHIKIGGRAYMAHRLAFLYMEGRFPNELTDHADGVKHNNKWENIREASYVENNRNKRTQDNNTSGFRGVRRHCNKWQARCSVNGKLTSLGSYSTPQEASLVYEQHTKKVFGEFYREA